MYAAFTIHTNEEIYIDEAFLKASPLHKLTTYLKPKKSVKWIFNRGETV
jgi:hypothetical protein